MTLPSWFVCLLGIGIVFIGLLILVGVCSLMGVFFKNKQDAPKAVAAAPVQQAAPIANKQELIAAVSAALAEELGEDVSAIRITSIKRI